MSINFFYFRDYRFWGLSYGRFRVLVVLFLCIVVRFYFFGELFLENILEVWVLKNYLFSVGRMCLGVW